MKLFSTSLLCAVALCAFSLNATPECAMKSCQPSECVTCEPNRDCCYNCDPADCPCSEEMADEPCKTMPMQPQPSREEYAQCEAFYKGLQAVYMDLGVHSQIEQAFQDYLDCHPEAAEVAKRYFGVDLENGERVLATPVYYINY